MAFETKAIISMLLSMPDSGSITLGRRQSLQIYLDESGDLGWKFDRPYRQGGSSKFLTLVFLILPPAHIKRPKKIIKKLYEKYKWQSEKKASEATVNQKNEFCLLTKQLLQKYPEIKIDVITVKKENVQTHIREDANTLYNYMIGLVIPDYVQNESKFDLFPDQRSIKVRSQNSLAEYLKIKLWFVIQCQTTVNCSPQTSAGNYNLQYADWLAHCMWSKYENGEEGYLNILKDTIKIRELFFH